MTPPPRWWVLTLLSAAHAVGAIWGGLMLGGALELELGRGGVALAIPTLLAAAFVHAALVARWRAAPPLPAAALALAALALTLLALLASPGEPGAAELTADWLEPAAFLAAAALAQALALLWLRAARRWSAAGRWTAALLAAALWWLGGHLLLGRAYLPRPDPQPGRTIVLTGLPLVTWTASGHPGAARREDPALAALRAMLARPPLLVDALAPGALRADDRLLLAHPHALAPATLVEVDRFVRAGGRAVLLADALSGWPAPFPLGDPRNPPLTSLLTPLLDRWGVSLAAPAPGDAAADLAVVRDRGHRLLLHSAGHFDRLPPTCSAGGRLPGYGGAAIARCRIGRGEAVLVADGDMLFAPLWRSAPPWARHLRRSDNVEWLAHELNGPAEPR